MPTEVIAPGLAGQGHFIRLAGWYMKETRPTCGSKLAFGICWSVECGVYRVPANGWEVLIPPVPR